MFGIVTMVREKSLKSIALENHRKCYGSETSLLSNTIA